MAADAGGVTSTPSLTEQKKIDTVLLNHHHFDHTRDLVTLAANANFYWRKQRKVCGICDTLDIVTDGVPSGKMYANFFEYPDKGKPTVILEAIDRYGRRDISDCDVLAVPVKHSAPYCRVSGRLC